MNRFAQKNKIDPGPELHIDVTSLKGGAMVLRAINHKLRQKMLRMIHSKKAVTVTEIYMDLKLEQSVASQHLAVLRRAGLVITARKGKFIYYQVNHDRLEQLRVLMAGILQSMPHPDATGQMQTS